MDKQSNELLSVSNSGRQSSLNTPVRGSSENSSITNRHQPLLSEEKTSSSATVSASEV